MSDKFVFKDWCFSIEMICRFNAIPDKISGRNFIDIDKLSPKFIWKGKENKVVKIFVKCKNKAGSLPLPDFNTCHKAAISKTL